MKILINNNIEYRYRFLLFLEKYVNSDKMKIMNAILHIVNNYDGKPIPPTAKALHDTGEDVLFEFRITLSKNLIRINYFIDYQNYCIVILNAYEKPNGAKDKNSYNKRKNKNEINTFIKKLINEALNLKKEYIINNQDYELLY